MTKTGKEGRVVRLRLTCVTAPKLPCEHEPAALGLQDRHQEVHPGQPHADGSVSYEINVPVNRNAETNAARFFGPYVHGTPAVPFLYLSWKRLGVEPASWIRRLKIPLPSMTWEQIAVMPENTVLAARVSGTRSGTVPLLDGGWALQDHNPVV